MLLGTIDVRCKAFVWSRLLGSRVRTPLRPWMSVFCVVCCVGSGLYEESICHSEQSYGVCVRDIETPTMCRPGPCLGCLATAKYGLISLTEWPGFRFHRGKGISESISNWQYPKSGGVMKLFVNFRMCNLPAFKRKCLLVQIVPARSVQCGSSSSSVLLLTANRKFRKNKPFALGRGRILKGLS